METQLMGNPDFYLKNMTAMIYLELPENKKAEVFEKAQRLRDVYKKFDFPEVINSIFFFTFLFNQYYETMLTDKRVQKESLRRFFSKTDAFDKFPKIQKALSISKIFKNK